jgi:hypothetical protein
MTKSLVKMLPAPKVFFSLENQKKIKYNYNTATNGAAGLKNEFSKKKLSTGWLSYWPQKGQKSTFWAISPVSNVVISVFFGAILTWVISIFLHY